MLKGFRRRAGKPAPGAELGGWYSSDIFHVFGQILSGLARLHAATGDPACREKAEALLDGWAECIEPDGYFFYSRKPNAPHYIYDKMVGGLTDMVIFCDSKLAAESLAKITGWAEKNLDRSNPYAFGGTEWYTLSENLYRAAPRDRRPALSRLRRRSGTTPSTGTSTRARATSSATAATAVGPASITPTATSTPSAARPRRISTRAIAGSSTRSSTPTTTWWPSSASRPADSVPTSSSCPATVWRRKTDYSHNSFETQCGCFAVFKLCKYLLTITGEARYGDWIERLAYNGIAATIPMSPDGLRLLLLRLQRTGRRRSATTPSAGRAAPAPARWRWPTCTTWSTSAAPTTCTSTCTCPRPWPGIAPSGPVIDPPAHAVPRVRIDEADRSAVACDRRPSG